MSNETFPDADARREQRKQMQREELSQEAVDLQTLMGEAWGRRIVYRMLDTAGVYTMSYVEGDPHHTSFNEGRRNMGNWLLSQLLALAPDEYGQMLKEHSNAA